MENDPKPMLDKASIQHHNTALGMSAQALRCVRCLAPTFGRLCAKCKGEKVVLKNDPPNHSFGADPDCRPVPERPWDSRGWVPEK